VSGIRRRDFGRFAGAARNRVRVDHQSEDRFLDRLDHSADADRPRRRSDRIAICLLRRICRLVAHRDVSVRRINSVGIGGIADMPRGLNAPNNVRF
jgi:hypothetical protein